MIRRLWRWYAHAAGVLLLAGAASYGVLQAFSVEGPVVETVEGPTALTTSIPYRGTLSYRLSIKRNASCPGTVVTSFTYKGGGPPITVLFSRPVAATDIKRTDDAGVAVALPESVFPGPWLYRSVVDSSCPTFTQQDVLAEFVITVTSNHGEVSNHDDGRS